MWRSVHPVAGETWMPFVAAPPDLLTLEPRRPGEPPPLAHPRNATPPTPNHSPGDEQSPRTGQP